MNKIVKDKEGNYILITENGEEFTCKEWFEKKTDKWYVVLPKGNPSGREYITREKIDIAIKYDSKFEFETKTTGPRVMTSGGWKSGLTKEEAEEYDQCEKRMSELKELGQKRLRERKPEAILDRFEELKRKYKELTGEDWNG